MADKLTKDQQKVVDTKNCNLLVAAAAGSGKTKVLVERIIKKVKDNGQDIDRLLIVTFTNAAAAEMRERIGKALEAELKKFPESEHLQRQMLLLHNAQITTIHSFCLSVIREFFHVIHLEPSFRIGDEAEISLLKSDVLENVLEQFYEKENAEFLSFVESYGSIKNDTQIIEYIQKLYDIAISHSWPKDWLDALSKEFELSEQWKNHPMSNQIINEVKNTVSDCLSIADTMISLTEEADGPALYRDCFIEDKKKIEKLLEETTDYEKISSAINSLKFGRLPSKKQENASEEKKQVAKDLRDYIKKQIDKLQKDFFFGDSAELLKDIEAMKDAMHGLILVTKEFISQYQKEKREKNLLDFNDLEHLALQILVEKTEQGEAPTAVARTLASRYDEIMIDEYQDSNLIQEAILNSISNEWDKTKHPNIFMVGDVKQSIYRFRMACPQLFMEKYRTYTDEGLYRKIDLHSNFRSRRTVLNAVNVLFAGLMHEEYTEVEYDGAAALNYAPDVEEGIDDYYPHQEEDYVEVLFIDTKEGKAKEEPSEKKEGVEESSDKKEEEELSQEELSMIQVEALAVANRIKDLIGSKFLVGRTNEQRPIDYGDIVILLRTMSGWSEKFLEILTEQGIPAFADTSSGYFKSFEIRKTLDFLRILDNPKQDIPLASVLHSPIAGFSAQELAQVQVKYGVISKKEKQYRYLYDAIKEAAKAEPEGRAAKFLALYDKLREEAAFVSIHELIERFYEYSGFYDVVTVMTGGERRKGNLDMLLAKAKQYESTSFSGLYDFIRYIDKLIKYEVDFGEAASGVSGKMVRIMSIHKSKGLEFPVVFLSGMEKKMNRQDMQKRLIFHSELGIGPEFVNIETRQKASTILKQAIAKKMNEELVSEELRILYVAMTRAKEKLILTGAMKEPEKRYMTWMKQGKNVGPKGLLFSYIVKAQTYYDFICPLLFQKEIRFAQIENGILVRQKAKLMEKKVENDIVTEEEKQFLGQFYLKQIQREDLDIANIVEEVIKEQLLDDLKQLEEEEIEKSDWEKEIYETLSRQASYVYPYEEEVKLPVKVTVSELKRLALEEEEIRETLAKETAVESLIEEPFEDFEEEMVVQTEEDCSYPEFLLPEKKLTGSDRGTAYHRVMELLPLETAMSKEQLTMILDEFVQSGILRPQEREVVSEYKLWKFLNSTLGKKMQIAAKQGKLHREQPFVLGLPAKEIYTDSDKEELVLVQGMIDAFFEEGDELVLLDYKTDYIPVGADAKEELTKKYKAQLKYYKKALESLKQKRVKEVWFYSFSKDLDFIVEE